MSQPPENESEPKRSFMEEYGEAMPPPPGQMPQYAYQRPVVAGANAPGAVTSLVLGILGLTLCGIFTAIPAIIVGGRAKREVIASGGRLGGGGLASAGVILGWVGVAFMLLGIVLLIGLLAASTTTSVSP